MNDNNVIAFPLKNPKIQKSIHESEFLKTLYITQLLSELVPMIFDYLDNAGFELFDENIKESDELRAEDFKKQTLIVEAIKSLLYDAEDIYHPFQTLASEVFESDEDPTKLKIVDELNINFID